MSVAPEIADADRAMLNARGSSRFQNVMAAIVIRLSGGKSVWKEHFVAASSGPASVGVAAE